MARNLLQPSIAALRRLGFASYRDYQRSEHWQTIRRLYRLTTLPQRCPCGKRGRQLHHQHYDLLGQEWRDLSCLKLLCGGCHQLIHDVSERPSDFVLRRDGRLHRGRKARVMY